MSRVNNQVNNQVNMLIESFNANSNQLVNFMSNYVKTLTFKIYKTEFDRLIRLNSDVIIDTFVLKVLQYEEHIMNENDDFFLGYINNNNNSDSDNMNIFEFKSIWHNLNDQNKDAIKAYMKLLCNIASVYRDIKINNI